MTIPYINHVTLTTSHVLRSTRAGVADETLALLSPWLQRLVAVGTPLALPVPELSHYAADARIEGDGLIVTVYGPAGPFRSGRAAPADIPLITLAVAQRSRHGADLWGLMVSIFGAAPGLRRPTEPWCAVALHPSLAAHREATQWLGDFERCVAWAWITRQPDLRPA